MTSSERAAFCIASTSTVSRKLNSAECNVVSFHMWFVPFTVIAAETNLRVSLSVYAN